MRRARYGKHLPWHQNLSRFVFDVTVIGVAFWLLFQWMFLLERLMVR